MSAVLLPVVILGPADATYAVIWLHGLGADGHDFEPIVPELNFRNKARTRFIFPHAPHRPVTINNGYVMRAWYDVTDISERAVEDADGIRDSAAQIAALISQERQRGIASEHIVLAGFSQGGAIVLHTSLRYAEKLAGVMVLSSYLPLRDTLTSEASAQNKSIPIFMAHGEHDPVVPFTLGELSYQQLARAGYAVDWHQYVMGHSVIPQQIEDISAWLDQVLT